MNSLLLLNNNIIRFLKNPYVFGVYVIMILVLLGCTFKYKFNFNKIPNFELILLIFIAYFSFFTPKYGILLIIFFSHYKITQMKTLVNNKVNEINRKKKELSKQRKIVPKSETFTPSLSKTISSKSSCQVCKAFDEPKFNSVAHFQNNKIQNKKIENRRIQEAGFRQQKHQNQRQPFR